MRVKDKSEKAGLKMDIQKSKIMANSNITSWQIDGEKVEEESMATHSSIAAGKIPWTEEPGGL